MLALLTAFCAGPTDPRPQFHTPQRTDAHALATDGLVLFRVPLTPELAQALPPASDHAKVWSGMVDKGARNAWGPPYRLRDALAQPADLAVAIGPARFLRPRLERLLVLDDVWLQLTPHGDPAYFASRQGDGLIQPLPLEP